MKEGVPMGGSGTKKVGERIEDAMREIGVLLLAFAPLDVALNRHERGALSFLLLFLGFGTALFTGALILERWRSNESLSNSRYLLIFLSLGAILMIAALVIGRGAQ